MPSQAASRRSSSHQTPATGSHHTGRDQSASVGPSSRVDDPKNAIAATFLASMLHEVVIDTALFVHAQVKRQKRAEGKIAGGCPVCKTACQRPADEKHTASGQERAIKKEAGEETPPLHTQDSTPATPKGLEMYQNNPLLACLVCSRQVSANRYAQHLASCVGVGKGGIARRKGKNGQSVLSSAKDRSKIKTALENRKKANFQTQSNRNTPTPMTRLEQESGSGASDDDSGPRKTKILADTLGLNGNGKRTLSPSSESAKRAKHNSMSAQTFVPSSLGSSLPLTGSPLNPHRNANKLKPALDGDEEEEEGEDDDDDDAEEEGDDDDEDDEDDDDDDEDDASVAALATGINRQTRNDSIADSFDDSDGGHSEAVSDTASFASKKKKQSSSTNNVIGTIERSKGSDGEYIDVESASAHSEVDDDF